jgi:hypothetical protein
MDRAQHDHCLEIQLAVVNALHIGRRPYLYIWSQYNALIHTTCLQIIKTNKFQSCFVRGSCFCRSVSVLPSHYYIGAITTEIDGDFNQFHLVFI